MNRKQKKFLKHFEPVRADLSRFCSALTRNSFDTKDLVNETLLSAFENFDNIKDKSSFKSYLFTTASRIYKRGKIKQKRMDYKDDLAEPEGTNNTEVNEDVNFLYECMDKLPEEQKEALILFEINGMKIKEISEIQSASESAVKSRLARGREKLKEIVEEELKVKKNLQNDEGITSVEYNQRVSK